MGTVLGIIEIAVIKTKEIIANISQELSCFAT